MTARNRQIKNKKTKFKSVEGQLPVAMLITAVLAIGTVAMWSYFSSLTSKLPAARANAQAYAVAESAMARVRLLLTRQTGTIIGGTTYACPDLSAFRNLNASPSALNTASFAPSGSLASTYDLGCVLKKTETTNFLDPSSPGPMTISVMPIGVPDIPTMTRTVRVEVIAYPKKQQGTLSVPQKLTRTYSLRVALPVDFGLILYGNGTTADRQIQVTGNSNLTLDIMSATLQTESSSGSMTTLDLDTVVDTASTLNTPHSPQIGFHRPFFISAPYINNSSFSKYNPYDLKPMFKAGIETNVLGRRHTGSSTAEVYTTVTPTQIGTQNDNLWNLPLDYQTPITKSGQQSMVSLPLPKNYTVGEISNSQTDDNLATSWYSAANAQEGTSVTLPQTAGMYFDKLEKTCASGATYVFFRAKDSLTLDFTDTGTVGSPAKGLPVFCGLVVADTLTINIPASNAYQPTAQTYALFGTFMVKKLIVNGNGGSATISVYLYNPSEQSASAVSLPSGQSQSGLYSQWAAKSNDITHRFFIPFSTVSSSIGEVYKSIFPTSKDVSTTMTIGYMETCPGCAHTIPNKHMCWKTAVEPLDYRCLFPGFNPATVKCDTPASNPGATTDYDKIGWFVVETM